MSDTKLTREEIAQQMIEIVAKEAMIDVSQVTLDTALESLKLDSMAMIMILMVIEERFNVYVPMDASLKEASVMRDLVDMLAGQIEKQRV